MTQPYINIHPFSPRRPSHLGCHITLSRVPCCLSILNLAVGTQVWSLVLEDPTCCKYWACCLEPGPQNKRGRPSEKPRHCSLGAAPAHRDRRKPCAAVETQPKINNYLSPLHFTYDSESLLNFPQHTHLQLRGHDPENGSWALTQVTFAFPRQKKRAWFVCLRDIPGQRNFQLPWVSVNSTEKEWPILHLWVYFKKHTY